MKTTQLARRPEDVRKRFNAVREEKKLRHRDAAAAIGLSEAHVLAAHVGEREGLVAHRLEERFPQIIASLSRVGPLMALTRNDAAVHERTGVYDGASADGHVGLVVGPDIDLRIFYHQWKFGFWVEERGERGVNRSLQFFDAHGDAVHKIFARPDTHEAGFRAVATASLSTSQTPTLEVEPRADPPPARDDAAIDVHALGQRWAALTDTHEFFGLLRAFGVQRLQAVRLMEGKFSRRVHQDALWQTLLLAARNFLEIMVFVPNKGCIQIHTGLVKNVQRMGSWANVLDPDFNLHVREDLIAHAYVVEKPTKDGVVTSLELFAKDGSAIAWLFGKRKPGFPEMQGWRSLVHGLPSSQVDRRSAFNEA
jgi:putative hemin transport protein